MTGRMVGVLMALLTFALAGCADAQRTLTAADQVPQLTVLLHRVDSALAAHRFAAAREDLRRLKAAVLKARDDGDLTDADATRVLEAIARLTAMLPEPSPTSTPSETPLTRDTPTTTATSRSPHPKPSAHPQVITPSATPTPTPSASATPSPTPSATPTSSPTPTAGQTREASPTASPTVGP